MLRQRSKDGRVLELSEMWRPAGLLDGQAMVCPDTGSPPGSVLAPLCANGYGHEGLDTWGETVVPAHCRGNVVLSRSADEVGLGCERAEDARRIREVVPKRCAQDGLASNTEQTPVVRCGRPPRSSAEHQPGTVSVRGFVHDGGQTWRGRSTIKRKTEGKRLRRTLGACWRWCRDHRHRAPQEQDVLLGAQLRGYSQ
jgi:RNA-directed DNA polymerase